MTTRKTGSGGAGGTVPRRAREEALLRLEPEQARYLDAGAALSFEFVFRGEYLYVGAMQRTSGWGSNLTRSPLCRLRYTGDAGSWDFEIYRYSRGAYDDEGEFPFGCGSPEMCFAVAADFYLLEYDVFSAGSSREQADSGPEPEFRGAAALLPPLELPDSVETPADLPGDFGAAGRPLLEDFDAFLGFVEGRTIDLAPRTLGFRREPLVEVNGLMRRPAPLHRRPVMSDAPRVQSCFHTATALGLLGVTRTLHRAEATEGIGRFRAMKEAERLWAVLEAMWHRVRWAVLRPRAFGDADALQAGRYVLGAELARRAEPLTFDRRLTRDAEILEVFLFPFWGDAGLLDLTHNRRMRVPDYLEKRTTRLGRVEPTEAGRVVFERLCETSPGREDLDRRAGPMDGRSLLHQAMQAGLFLDSDPADWEEWTDEE